MHTRFWWVNHERRRLLEVLGIDGDVILKE